MHIKDYLALLVILLVVATAFFFNASTASFSSAGQDNQTLYQVYTYNSLASGNYDGNVTIGEVKKHGNTGLGTINGLNGEMIVLDGVFYQVQNDGTVHVISDSEMTPFAMVTFFSPDKLLVLNDTINMTQFEGRLDGYLPSSNLFYAIVVKGEFQDLDVRSEPKQSEPYPSLSDALENQTVYHLHHVNGTMVGFWYPQSASSVNNPGYHFHFLSVDKSIGGHVLGFETEKAVVGLDYISQLDVE